MGFGSWLIERIGSYLNKDRLESRSYLCDFDRICHEIRPTDVLLIEGRNYVSRVIQRITISPWSHAALYIGRLHDVEDPLIREYLQKNYKGKIGKQLLIESIVGKGTLVSSIDDYKNEHIRICRPMGVSYSDTQKVIAFAAKHIGKKYNIRHFFDLGRFLLASRIIPRRLKSSLFEYKPGQATQDICSAMLASAFASIKFPVLPLIRKDQKQNFELIHRNPKLFTPSDFDYSPYFSIIKYPMLPVAEIEPYRKLPWREGLISHDEVGIEKESAEQHAEHSQPKDKS